LIARRLKRPFYDSDHEIERRCGVKVPVIFDIEGEAGFRQREAAVIAELAALENVVVATGGGAVLAAASRRLLASRGTVIYLHAPPEALYARVRQDKNRPLLATSDPLARLRELYAQRDPLYREIADIVADTGPQSVQSLVRQLLGRLREGWKLSA
jgi:shikimate kinase